MEEPGWTSVRHNTGIPVFLLRPVVADNCCRGNAFVYDTDLVWQLCREITGEKDPERVEELLSLLRAVVKEDQEEIRVRMKFLAKKYFISATNAAD